MRTLATLLAGLMISLASPGQTNFKPTPALLNKIKADFKKEVTPFLDDPYSYQFKDIKILDTYEAENPLAGEIRAIDKELEQIEMDRRYSSEDVVLNADVSRMTPAQLKAYEARNAKIKARADSITNLRENRFVELLLKKQELNDQLKKQPKSTIYGYSVMIGFYARNKLGRMRYARALFRYGVKTGVDVLTTRII